MIHPNKVIIRKDVLQKIHRDARFWSSRRLESGGYLFGIIHNPSLVIEPTDFIDGGPNARRTAISFSPDNEYAAARKAEIQTARPNIRLLGEYHLHPWSVYPHPSGGDKHQLQQIKNSQRPWYVIMLVTLNGFRFWDLDKQGKEFVELPHQVIRIPASIDERELLDRVSKITQHELLAKKTVMIVGLGSGGSVIAKYLGNTGIGNFILVDNEKLELANVIRHEGTIEDIGKPKTEICRKAIELHNPFARIRTYEMDVLKETNRLEELVASSDLVIASSGSAKVNSLINKLSIEKNIPAVYGGIFEKASGGYVLSVVPNRTACFNCMFNVTAQSYYVDRSAAQAYNLSEDELHAQQGLWVDLSIPALCLAKLALMILQGKTAFLEEYNLLLYTNPLDLKRYKVDRRIDCSVCNFEGWLRQQEIHQTKQERQSILSRLKRRVIHKQ